MWSYSQSTGRLSFAGSLVATGYSGKAGPGRNNPAMQNVPDVGPIPQYRYSIGPAFDAPVQGPCSMRLSPQGPDPFGRSGFMIHGDNATHDASTGCVVLPAEVRWMIALGTDPELEVTA